MAVCADAHPLSARYGNAAIAYVCSRTDTLTTSRHRVPRVKGSPNGGSCHCKQSHASLWAENRMYSGIGFLITLFVVFAVIYLVRKT